MFVLLAVAVLCLLHTHVFADNATITSPPKSVNVTEGSSVVFTCTGTRGIFFRWLVNNLFDNHPEVVGRGVTIYTEIIDSELKLMESNLTIPATKDNNNISIQCILVGLTRGDGPTDPAVLLVQGLLEVPALYFIPEGKCPLLTWCLPDSLDGIPILEYTVYVTDTNSSVTLVNSTTVQAVYHLCDSLFTQDHVYELSVAAVNVLGVGSEKMIIHHFHKNATLVQVLNLHKEVSIAEINIYPSSSSIFNSSFKTAVLRSSLLDESLESLELSTLKSSIIVSCSNSGSDDDDIIVLTTDKTDVDLIIIISIGVVLFIVGTAVGGIICCAVYHYCLLGKKQACIGSSDIPVQINHAYEEVKFQSQQQRQHGLARQQQRQNHQDVILTHSHFQT